MPQWCFGAQARVATSSRTRSTTASPLAPARPVLHRSPRGCPRARMALMPRGCVHVKSTSPPRCSTLRSTRTVCNRRLCLAPRCNRPRASTSAAARAGGSRAVLPLWPCRRRCGHTATRARCSRLCRAPSPSKASPPGPLSSESSDGWVHRAVGCTRRRAHAGPAAHLHARPHLREQRQPLLCPPRHNPPHTARGALHRGRATGTGYCPGCCDRARRCSAGGVSRALVARVAR